MTGGTNGETKLNRLGMSGYFDVVIVAPIHGWSKREPEPFNAALEELEAAPAETAVVGDRPAVDFVQPNRMGLLTVRVRRGRYATVRASTAAEPDHVVDCLSSVPDVLRRAQPAESGATSAADRDQ